MYIVLLMYKYVSIDDCQATAKWFRDICSQFQTADFQIRGRTIIAPEGINSTIEVYREFVDEICAKIHANPLFSDMNIKTSQGTGSLFPRFSLKIRNEIVGTHFPEHIDPRVKTAPHLPVEELHRMYRQNQDFIVVDMRNDYEIACGYFEKTLNLGLKNSRDLMQALENNPLPKDKKIITVCTGGVRCEKMSAVLLDKGYDNVFQLENGIHAYMEKYPAQDFLGTLYTFDKRVVMDFGGKRAIVGECSKCHGKTEQFVDCANISCRQHFLLCHDCLAKYGHACSESCHAQSLNQNITKTQDEQNQNNHQHKN